MNTQEKLREDSRNVLIAADYTAPKSGNFIASMLDLAETLQKEGRKTVFLLPERAKQSPWTEWLASHGYPVFFLDNKTGGEETLSFVRELVEKHRIGLIHLHFGYLVRELLPAHRSFGTALVIHDHFDFVTTSSQIRQRLSTIKKALL